MDEKRIITDEDWKQQAQKEKEKLAQGVQAPQLPKPSFSYLVSGLVSQALVGLGHIANPITGKSEVSIEEAKFAIDMLQMLRDKTQGNLTDEEKKNLESVLYDLRMRFIDAANS